MKNYCCSEHLEFKISDNFQLLNDWIKCYTYSSDDYINNIDNNSTNTSDILILS